MHPSCFRSLSLPIAICLALLITSTRAAAEVKANRRAGASTGILTPSDADKILAALVDGVRAIDAPGIPGPLAAFGKNAIPVIVGEASKKVRAPVVVAAIWGSGRIVAFGHNGYFDAKSLAVADSGRFMLNAVRWAGHVNNNSSSTLRVGVWRNQGLAEFFRSHGIQAVMLDASASVRQLATCRVVCANIHDMDNDRVLGTVGEYLRCGGGFVAGGLGWGWLQLNPGRILSAHPGNRLLGPAGILWLDGSLGRTDRVGYATTPRPGPLCQASRALDRLATAGESPLSPDEAAEATWGLIQIGPALGVSDVPRPDPEFRLLQVAFAGRSQPLRGRKRECLPVPVARFAEHPAEVGNH